MKIFIRMKKNKANRFFLSICLFFIIINPLSTAQAEDGDLSSEEIFELIYETGTDWVSDISEEYSEYEFEYEIDEKLLHSILQKLMHVLHQQSIIDLMYFKEDAYNLYNYLNQFEETEPYAIWLKERLDYFEASEQIYLQLKQAKITSKTHKPETELQKKSKQKTTRPPQTVTKTFQPEKTLVKSTAIPSRWETSLNVWQQKARKKPIPENAPELVPRIKNIFRKQGIPPHWVWLAEVESSFRIKAKSPVGAAGLFQLMPKTAERFGVSVSPVDYRYHLSKSAKASAEYLKFLYNKFGTWPLTFAAYNAGEGRVGRLLKKHNGKSINDILPYLPSETQMYVPKVIANHSPA